MAKAASFDHGTRGKRPRLRAGDRVTLASHKSPIPAYGGKPFVGRDFALRVSSVSGKGTLRDPWGIHVTDDAGNFWHLLPDDVVLADESPSRSHSTRKTPTQLQREIDESLSRTFRTLVTAPRSEVGEAVRYTITDKITPKNGGVEVETVSEGAEGREHFEKRSKKFYPGVSLEAAAAYRLQHGYRELRKLG